MRSKPRKASTWPANRTRCAAQVENNKLAGNAVNLIRERGASVFDASVPKRVGMQKVIGHAFPSNLNGYEDVYLELEEAIA